MLLCKVLEDLDVSLGQLARWCDVSRQQAWTWCHGASFEGRLDDMRSVGVEVRQRRAQTGAGK